MDDMAGIKALRNRRIDKTRVGIYGTSYGGYTSAAMLFGDPDVVTVAFVVACHRLATIRTTCTEPYGIPQRMRKATTPVHRGYGNLRGRLLLYYGTADNNVHRTTDATVQALQRAGKSFELLGGQSHTAA
jgi:dipeptidyl-peptidase-4